MAIDDDATTTLLVMEMFSVRGYRVVSATGGAEALEKIDLVQPDIILLDIMMPGMDGYETCSRIKAIPEFALTPIVMLTSYDDVDAVERAYECGASDFISKPINWPILIHRVDYAVRAARAFANEAQAAKLSRAIDISPSQILMFHSHSLKVLYANTSAKNNLGYSENELEALAFEDVTTIPKSSRLKEKILRLGEGQQITLSVDMRRADGSCFPAEGFVIQSSEGGSQSFIGIFQDISERKKAEEELHRLAFYDVLTGLPNRRLMREHVERSLAFAARKSTSCAMLIMDLDGFKQINDTLGHKVGDLLLKEVSNRLSGLLRKTDIVAHDTSTGAKVSEGQVARLGGDEFILLLTEVSDTSGLTKVAARVLEEIAKPYNVNERVLNITCSIGIALYPENGTTLDELMMRADSAMYDAKRAGKNTYAFSSKK